MNFDDEKDLQQILFLAARILERRHNQTSGTRSPPPRNKRIAINLGWTM